MDFDSEEYLWERLVRERRPIALYGMGDGADKCLRRCEVHGVPVAAVFASDGFVRGQSYRGYPVRTLAQVEESLGDFLVLLCFATERPEVLAQIDAVAARHTLLAPDFPVAGDTYITPAYLRQRQSEIKQLEALLADDQSRRVLRDSLRYKLTGEPRYLRRCETIRDEAFEQILRPGGDEFYVDAGAYTGDTVAEFARRTGGNYRRILAIEPDSRNFAKLQKTAALDPERIACVNIGAWSHKTTLRFDHRSGRQAALRTSGTDIPNTPADSIDNLAAGSGDTPTLLKYDVEGAEREAVLGSAETIRRHKPRLALAVYHRGGDLIDLPLLLHRLRPDYKLHLRHHPYLPAWETYCYAI